MTIGQVLALLCTFNGEILTRKKLRLFHDEWSASRVLVA